jgi:hypothetical protein
MLLLDSYEDKRSSRMKLLVSSSVAWQADAMQTQALSRLPLILATIWLVEKAAGADLQFKHHFIDRSLPVTDRLV